MTLLSFLCYKSKSNEIFTKNEPYISFLNNRIFNKFGGRLGNNITQLANIIVIAIAYKHNIKFNVTPLNI